MPCSTPSCSHTIANPVFSSSDRPLEAWRPVSFVHEGDALQGEAPQRSKSDAKRRRQITGLDETRCRMLEELSCLTTNHVQLKHKREALQMLLSCQMGIMEALKGTDLGWREIERPLPSPVPLGQSFYPGPSCPGLGTDMYRHLSAGDARATWCAVVKDLMPLVQNSGPPPGIPSEREGAISAIVGTITTHCEELLIHNPALSVRIKGLNMETGCWAPPAPGYLEDIVQQVYDHFPEESLALLDVAHMTYCRWLAKVRKRQYKAVSQLQALDVSKGEEVLAPVLERQALVQQLTRAMREEYLAHVLVSKFYRKVVPQVIRGLLWVKAYPYIADACTVVEVCMQRYRGRVPSTAG